MKIVSVAQEDTNIMLGLLGVQGYVISSQEPQIFQEEFDKILQDEEIGIILINEKYLLRHKSYFKKKKNQKLPIIVEIPDIKAPLNEDYFQELIEKFIGIKI